MNIQMLKDYFQEFIDDKQHKIMFLNRKKDMFEEFKVIDAINLLEEKDKEIERLNNIIKEAIEYLKDNACYNDMGNFNDDLDYDKCGDLLDILKGSDKE